MFILHPQLAADTLVLGSFPLSLVLLMNDAQFPWCILVPKRADITEVYELLPEDQQQLAAESSCLGRQLMAAFEGHKLNVAALGNVVPQLHIHHIVRYHHDSAWPKPIWGLFQPQPYESIKLNSQKAKIISQLKQGKISFQPE